MRNSFRQEAPKVKGALQQKSDFLIRNSGRLRYLSKGWPHVKRVVFRSEMALDTEARHRKEQPKLYYYYYYY